MAQYHGSAAIDLQDDAYVAQTPLQESERKLTVLPGSGASVETKLSPLTVTLIKCAVAFAVVLTVLAVGNILLKSLAYGYVYDNTVLQYNIDDARSAGSTLEVEQSVFGNAERISRLAQHYGMVNGEAAAVVDLSSAAVAVSDAETA